MQSFSVLIILLCTLEALAFRFGGHQMVSEAQLKTALANPSSYQFDDGGSISFGHGFYARRFNFKGQAQACYSSGYLYAGRQKDCVKPMYDSEGGVAGCQKEQDIELKTKMVGVRKVCVTQGEGGEICSQYSTVKFKKGPKVKVAVYKKALMDRKDPLAGFLGFAYLKLPACSF